MLYRKVCYPFLIHDPHTAIISLRISRNYEAIASELLGNLDEYYIYSDKFYLTIGKRIFLIFCISFVWIVTLVNLELSTICRWCKHYPVLDGLISSVVFLYWIVCVFALFRQRRRVSPSGALIG